MNEIKESKGKQTAKKQDIHKIYAILSQDEGHQFPEDILEEHFTVPFLDHNGERREAKGCLYLPASQKPVPLVYFSYYTIAKDSFELAHYLKEGWAVASPFEEADHNPEVTRDGLVSNSALLYELRHRAELDADRIAIVGGSAGGYTAMMLSALHLAACCTVANGAVANAYFTFRHYAPYLSAFNHPVEMALREEGRSDLMTLFSKLPIPYGIVFNTFRTPKMDARLDDLRIAAAVAPSMLADCYSNPLMEVHNTSDILVPVDQITRSFTYEHVSGGLPADFKIHLADYALPEGFDRSFAEQLPEGSFTERQIPVVPKGKIEELPFDEKRFQINIIDEGEPQSHGSHGSDIPKGNVTQRAYLHQAFARGCANNFLPDGKLKLLVERYAGRSIQLPAHEGDVYGSLMVYRKEVLEQLSAYQKRHPAEDLSGRLRELAECSDVLAEAAQDCIMELQQDWLL